MTADDEAVIRAWLRTRCTESSDWLSTRPPGTRRYTETQAAYLAAQAYVAGRRHTYEELTEEKHTWAMRTRPALTYEQRVAQRLADMNTPPRLYLGGAVDWETGEVI